MATAYKNTSVQGTSGLTSYATLYNTTASSTAVLSTIVICNRSSASKQFRIGVTGSAGTPANSQFIVYDASIEGNDSIFLTVGVSLGNTQYVRISSTDSNLSFSAYVSEIT